MHYFTIQVTLGSFQGGYVRSSELRVNNKCTHAYQ